MCHAEAAMLHQISLLAKEYFRGKEWGLLQPVAEMQSQIRKLKAAKHFL